jgi:hypothetical protein
MIGTIFMDGREFELYAGINAPDGTLLLPSKSKGAAFYLNTIWVHRLWNSGWLQLHNGSEITISFANGRTSKYIAESKTFQPYGKYFGTGTGFEYIASCYSDNGKWEGIELYKLKLIETHFRYSK